MIQVSEKDIKSLKVTLIEVCNATSHTRSKKDLFLVNKTKFTMLVESQNYSPESQATLMKLYDKLDSRKTDSIDCRLILVGMCALSCIPLEERFQYAIEIYEINDLEPLVADTTVNIVLTLFDIMNKNKLLPEERTEITNYINTVFEDIN